MGGGCAVPSLTRSGGAPAMTWRGRRAAAAPGPISSPDIEWSAGERELRNDQRAWSKVIGDYQHIRSADAPLTMLDHEFWKGTRRPRAKRARSIVSQKTGSNLRVTRARAGLGPDAREDPTFVPQHVHPQQ